MGSTVYSTDCRTVLDVVFRETFQLMALEYNYNDIVWAVVWDQNKAVNIWGWPICGGGRLERCYCIYKRRPLVGAIPRDPVRLVLC